ncbi:MAG: heparinase II/III family protein [Candidatus Nanopelagicales bacterium]
MLVSQVALVTGALAASLISAPMVQAADDTPSQLTVDTSGLGSTVCKKALGVANRITVDASDFYESGELTLNDWRVNPAAVNWQTAHPKHATYTVVFHSAAWLIPDSPLGVGAAIDAMIEQSRLSPDPGNQASAILNNTGWKESHTTKRLNTAVCLYSLARTPEQRIGMTAVVEQLVAANLDPNRYYGPPKRKAHNHGIMADQALSQAARYLDRPAWSAAGSRRVAAQLGETFDSCGMTFEQSSAYHSLHIRLWDAVTRWADPATIERINETLVKARQARNLMIRPDGELVRIGDGLERTYASRTPVANDRIWCPETGWFAATSNRNSVVQHAVVRFGPGRDVHGHDDRGQVVWWVGDGDTGVPVLSDRGAYKKTDLERTDYAHTSAAHSTLQWAGSTGVSMKGQLRTSSSNTVVTLRSGQRVGDWTRTIAQATNQYRLIVADSVTSTNSLGRIVQRFTLDPIWSPQSNRSQKRAAYVTASGWKLQVICTVDNRRVTPRNVLVEHFPARDTIENAVSIDCGTGKARTNSRLRAVLQVTPPTR